MGGFLHSVFSSGDFMPHGMCYLWRRDVLLLHTISDALIFLAYSSIPFTLLYFVRRRKDLQFEWMFVCFAVFIVACGATHLLEIITIWHPIYWISGVVKAVTAAASVPTAILLVTLVPRALKLPSPAALQRVNEQLAEEIRERRRAEDVVRRINEVLEVRVAERTRALQVALEDLKRTQRAIMQQERLRALGQMASGIAHDINNALTPAALCTQSLLSPEMGLDAEGRESLEMIRQAIEDATHTVARIKDFYRDSGGTRNYVCLEIRNLLAQVVELTRARWESMPQEAGVVVELKTEYAPDLPLILGSPSAIREALTNLIFNAVDAMPEGGTLSLRCYASDRVYVEIRDTGIGMTEDVRSRCLELFFTTKGERGTGVGLAMVYGMVQQHRATLKIESEPGAGTVVRLGFLIESFATTVAANDPVLLRRARGLRILVIDDDELLRRSLRKTLEREGHTVCVAASGRSGIEMFAQSMHRGESFSIVITDLGMPHMDGRMVSASIKEIAPETPVVMLTGWGHRLLDENDMPAHVDRLLSKPPSLAHLRSMLLELTECPSEEH